MFKACLLILLATLSCVTATTDNFFDQVELIEYEPDAELVGEDYDYNMMFDAKFTVTIFGIPATMGGGQKDLAKFGKFFLKRFNAVQKKIEKKDAKASDADLEEPGILMYQTEVVEQYVSEDKLNDGNACHYNILEIASSLICVEEECPSEAVDDGRRELSFAGDEGAQRRLVSVANNLLKKLKKSGRSYFADVSCVRVTSALSDFEDSTPGCDAYPAVTASA